MTKWHVRCPYGVHYVICGSRYVASLIHLLELRWIKLSLLWKFLGADRWIRWIPLGRRRRRGWLFRNRFFLDRTAATTPACSILSASEGISFLVHLRMSSQHFGHLTLLCGSTINIELTNNCACIRYYMLGTLKVIGTTECSYITYRRK